MDLPLPPADADFIRPEREYSRDGRRFTWAELEYNCRLTTAKELRDAELAAHGTPVRDGFIKILELLK